MKPATVTYHPTPHVTITGQYEAGDPGDRDTPPQSSAIDPDSLTISGDLYHVGVWLTEEFTDSEDLAAVMCEQHEADLEFERDAEAEAKYDAIAIEQEMYDPRA